MYTRSIPFAALAVATMFLGCTAPGVYSSKANADDSATQPAAGSAAVKAEEPVVGETCLSLASIRESRVIDDKTIDFIMNGGKIYRNTLPYACPSLGFEKAFGYSTSLSQLCSTDIIRVIHQGGGPRFGAGCGLGKFVPYTPPSNTSVEE